MGCSQSTSSTAEADAAVTLEAPPNTPAESEKSASKRESSKASKRRSSLQKLSTQLSWHERASVRRSSRGKDDTTLQRLSADRLFSGRDARQVWDAYEKLGVLGTGSFGTVYRAKDRQGSGTMVAIKQVGKEQAAATGAEKGAFEEFAMCVRISHPHVLRVFSYFDTPHSLYIVSEIAAGGELHEYLCSHPELNDEAGIARLVSQGLAAIVHLHHEGMTHHDVKPPNLLVTGHAWAGDASGATPLVVLADFGTAKLMQKAAHRVRRVSIVEGEGSKKEVKAVEVLGTPEYCGPECFSTLGAAHDAGRHSDVYALGVTIFELLVGEKPFQIEWGDVFDPDFDPTDTAKHWAQMMDVNLEADWSALKGVSDEGVALLRRMLNKRHDERPTAAECAEASWFHNVLEEGHAEVPAAELEARAARAAKRAQMCFFGKALLNMAAARLADDVLQRERAIFMGADRMTGAGDERINGKLSAEEVQQLFSREGWDKARAAQVLQRVDLDGDGKIGFNEWVAATVDLNPASSKTAAAHAKALFDQLDVDGDGKIHLSELRSHFGELSKEHEKALKAFFEKLDRDGNDSIDRAEFGAWLMEVSGEALTVRAAAPGVVLVADVAEDDEDEEDQEERARIGRLSRRLSAGAVTSVEKIELREDHAARADGEEPPKAPLVARRSENLQRLGTLGGTLKNMLLEID